MTTDETIMEEMLDRATNPAKDCVDELGVQMFCIVVRSNVQLVHKAQEMIVAKVRSSNVTQATRAIALLEECMTQCGVDFQDEAAKFRFLNELIRLVSKKYQGAETPHEVKQRIMECLLLWTTEFPQRPKIRDAYDMLRKEGDIEHGQSPAAVAKRESVLGSIDEAKFAKLIKSNDPENFKRANLLVQYRMRQEARHNEVLAQHRLMLQETQNTMQLLNQMLDSYDGSDEDVNETMRELYRSCKKKRSIFQHLPELLNDTDSQLIADTLDANTALVALIARYKQVVPSPTKTASSTAAATAAASCRAELGGDNKPSVNSNNAALLDELLGELMPSVEPAQHDALADLSEIFSSALNENEQQQPHTLRPNELLEPQVLGNSTLSNGSASSDNSKMSTAGRKMPQIDMLSDELFQQILPMEERMVSFKREAEKLTLNDLARERMHVKPETLTQAPSEPLDDAPMLSTASAELPATVEPVAEALPVKPLSEIDMDLDCIEATMEQRLMLDDDDMQLSLNFTKNRPSRHVCVLVLVAQNKSAQPVKDLQFEASVRKPCKVRLLPATDSAMTATKPFRPATPINQLMLLYNPTGQHVDVTCIVSYKLGDDPDAIKESIVVKDLPHVQ